MIKRLPDTDAIVSSVIANDGYCPCKLIKSDDTRCMCKEFREQTSGDCHCGLYTKVDESLDSNDVKED